MKGTRFTLDDIKRKGLQIVGEHPLVIEKFSAPKIAKSGRPALPPVDASAYDYNEVQEHLAKLHEKSEQNKSCKIVINGVVHGLNGSNGLMQKHWAKNKKIKEGYINLIKAQKTITFDCQVELHYIGYKTRLMDWDNFGASFKHLGDGLVACGIIKDDSPEIIKHFIPRQVKCKQKEQMVEIIIIAV